LSRPPSYLYDASMHLAYVIDNLGSGGAQRQLVEIARRVSLETGWRVSCLVYHDSDFYGPRLSEVGIPIVRLPKRGRLDPFFPIRLGAWLRAEQVDVVHAFLTLPALWSVVAVKAWAGWRRPALIASERDCRIATSWGLRASQGLAYHGADLVTANCAVAAREIAARLHVAPSRIRYIPNGIDLEAWDRAAEEPSPLPREPGCFHLGLIGRLQPQKNHPLLVEALGRLDPAQHAHWRIWFIGARSGGEAAAQAIEEHVARAGLEKQVRFIPATPRVAAVMGALDALVLPSRHEGFPNVVLEAMASRLPVVASRVGDVPRLVEDGRTGFVFESDDAEGLAAALLRVSALSPSERSTMGRRAREVVESDYRIESIASLHVELYAQLARRTGRRARSPALDLGTGT
jgi:glycosyltransferase involved in cell wall biosynthesis